MPKEPWCRGPAAWTFLALTLTAGLPACGGRSSLLTGAPGASTNGDGGERRDTGASDARDASQCPPDVCPVVLATGGHPDAIAVSEKDVYWTSDAPDGHGYVARSPIGGGHVATLAITVGRARAIAVDAASVYWTDAGSSDAKADGTVMTASLAGGAPKALRRHQVSPTTLALDGAILFWGSASAQSANPIQSLQLGGAGTYHGSRGLGFGETTGLAVVNDDVFATYVEGGDWGAAPNGVAISGSEPGAATFDGIPSSIAADATHVYWTIRGNTPSSGAVMAAPYPAPDADGYPNLGAVVTLATRQNNPDGIAVDASGVYWTTGTLDGTTADGTVEWLAPGATGSVSLASGQSAPHRVALDGQNIYWTDGGVAGADGSVMQLAKRQACTAGSCGCPAGETMCSTGCADTSSDLAHCGGCDNVCNGGPAGPGICENGHCIVTLAWGAYNMAVTGDTVYWVGDEGVFSTSTSGGVASNVSMNQAITAIAADSGGAVWLSPVPSLLGTTGVIVAAPMQSGSALAIDASYAYWVDPSTITINRIARGGGASEVIGTNTTLYVGAVAVDATSLYRAGQELVKMPKGGGASVTLATVSMSHRFSQYSIAVDTTSVYWIDGGAVMKTPIAGGPSVTLSTVGPADSSCLAVDASDVYVGIDGAIVRVPIDGGPTELVAPGINGPTSIAVDATSVYWADPFGSGTGRVMKASK